MGKKERRHLEALQRRADWLARRVAEAADRNDLSYDRAELAALLWALQRVEPRLGDRK